MQDQSMEVNIHISPTYQTHFLYVINSIPTIVLIIIIIHMANKNINSPTNQLQFYFIPTFPANILTKTTN